MFRISLYLKDNIKLRMRAVKNILFLAVLLCAGSPAIAHHTCNQSAQIKALAMNMYHEARGEGPDAMQLVGEVTLNRVESKHFPNTVCGVVYQARLDSKGIPKRHACQFSWYCDGRSDKPKDKKLWDLAYAIATGLINENINLLGSTATHYHTENVKPSWSQKYTMLGKYGGHIFYEMGNKL